MDAPNKVDWFGSVLVAADAIAHLAVGFSRIDIRGEFEDRQVFNPEVGLWTYSVPIARKSLAAVCGGLVGCRLFAADEGAPLVSDMISKGLADPSLFQSSNAQFDFVDWAMLVSLAICEAKSNKDELLEVIADDLFSDRMRGRLIYPNEESLREIHEAESRATMLLRRHRNELEQLATRLAKQNGGLSAEEIYSLVGSRFSGIQPISKRIEADYPNVSRQQERAYSRRVAK